MNYQNHLQKHNIGMLHVEEEKLRVCVTSPILRIGGYAQVASPQLSRRVFNSELHCKRERLWAQRPITRLILDGHDRYISCTAEYGMRDFIYHIINHMDGHLWRDVVIKEIWKAKAFFYGGYGRNIGA